MNIILLNCAIRGGDRVPLDAMLRHKQYVDCIG
jgi:hypothetical protein